MQVHPWSVPALLKWFAAFLLVEWLAIPLQSRQALITLSLFMAADIATGLWAAAGAGRIDSSVGRKGISKKLATLAFLLMVHAIEKLGGAELNLELVGAIGYTLNEAISIIENFTLLGVPIPGQLVAALLKAKQLRITPATEEQLRQLREDGGKNG